jgi:hypothetical protein
LAFPSPFPAQSSQPLGFISFDFCSFILSQAREQMLAQAKEAAIPREVPECVEMKQQLLDLASALKLPPAPLDALIDALGGPAKVFHFHFLFFAPKNDL